MKKIVLTLLYCLLPLSFIFAQGPKWVPKAKKSVFSIISFDKNNQILNKGNGFFIDSKGIGVSGFKVLKGASRAVIIDTEGHEMAIQSLLGADETYNAVKFQVDTKNRKVAALEIETEAQVIGNEIVVLPYSVENDRACRPGVIRTIETIRDGYKFFTLDLRETESLISCPVMSASGKVIGLLEQTYGSTRSDVICHALDINFINSLKINALSFDDSSLNDIYIRTALPESEDQALAYLFMVKNKVSSADYLSLLNEFNKTYPNLLEGYFNIAQYYLEKDSVTKMDLNKASEFIDRALKLKGANMGDANYGAARLISIGHFVPVAKDNKEWGLDVAISLLNEAYNINPLPIYLQMKGDIYATQENWADAIACYDEVNKSDIASPQSFLATAQVQELAGSDLSIVINTLDSCISRLKTPYDVNSTVFLFERARIYNKAEQYRNAVLDLNSYYDALNGSVDDSFYYYRSQTAQKAKMYQLALDDMKLALEFRPNEVVYLVEYAALNLKVGRYPEALNLLDKALVFDPQNGEIYRLQGVTYIQMKDDRACQSLQKAKEYGDPYAEGLIEKFCSKK